MTVHKSLIAITLLLIGALTVGSVYYTDTYIMSFAGTDMFSMVVRGVIAALLVALLLTNPPRSYVTRSIIGASSIVIALLSTQMLLSYQINLLDMIVFMEVAVIFGIEALETRTVIPVRQKDTPARKIPVLSI